VFQQLNKITAMFSVPTRYELTPGFTCGAIVMTYLNVTIGDKLILAD